MRVFDRYILGEILRPLLVALLIALAVFVISRIIQLLDLVLGAEGPLKVIFQMVGFLVPHYLSLALPLSLLLGVMVGFSRMNRDGELDALAAAGMGLARQLRPVLLIALVVAVIYAGILGYLRPYARYAYQAVIYAITNVALHASVRAGVFAQLDDITLLVQGIGADGVSVAKIFLYQEKEEGGAMVIAARDGGLVRAEAFGPPVLRLFDGVRLTTGSGDGAAGRPSEAGALHFQEMRMTLSRGEAGMFRPRGEDEREMTIAELWQRRDSPPQKVKVSDLEAELHSRLVRILSVPFLPMLAVFLAFGRRRSDRFAGFAAGIVSLVVYERIIDFGKNVVESGQISPWVGLWLPFLIFALLCLGLFARSALVVPSTPTLGLLSALGLGGGRSKAVAMGET